MTGPTLVTGAAGFAGSHLLDSACRRRHRDRRLAPPGRTSADGCARRLLAGCRPAGSASGQVGSPLRAAGSRLPLRRRGTCRASRGARSPNALGQRPRHAPLAEALRDEAPQARLLVTSSALVYAPSRTPSTKRHPTVPDNPYGLSKLAQELAAGRFDGPPVYLARPFNHFGPRQDPGVRVGRFRQTDRGNRAWPEAAGDSGRQPRGTPRPHRRPRHGARVPD